MKIKEDVSVGSGIIGKFTRLKNKLERVFAEFIDNSTQSFFDHRKELESIDVTSCRVKIIWDENEIVIIDNAFGMNHEEFRRALRLNAQADSYSDNSRSKYGMGLKIAASYLGRSFTIDTSAYGSKEQYSGTVDIDYFEQNNPTQLECDLTETDIADHFTRIIIRKVEQKCTQSAIDNLRKNLANIYFDDLSRGDLELSLNGVQIDAPDPVLRKNSETGSDYFASFEDSFNVGLKTYKYNGWIGILNKASVEGAGFTILQYGRGIVLNYRPKELFGASNSFPYQRIVGQISFDGSDLAVSFNKDGFVMDAITEKAFINSLKFNEEVMKMVNLAKTLRKEETAKPVIKSEDLPKITGTIASNFSGLKSVKKTVVETPKTDEPIYVIKAEDETPDRKVDIEFEGIKYKLTIVVNNEDPEADWLSIKKKGDDNSYYLIINGVSNYFKDLKNKEAKEMLVNFAVAIALARLSSSSIIEDQKAKVVLNQLNKIIKNAKPQED